LNAEKTRLEFLFESAGPSWLEVGMDTVQQIAPMFLLIQFLVVLLALVAATRLADPQISNRWRNSSSAKRASMRGSER
jgi:hypothetical protein